MHKPAFLLQHINSMHELHQSVAAGVMQTTARQHACASSKLQLGVRWSFESRCRSVQQQALPDKAARDTQLAVEVQQAHHHQQPNQNAVRYASAARRVTAKHQLALGTATPQPRGQQSRLLQKQLEEQQKQQQQQKHEASSTASSTHSIGLHAHTGNSSSHEHTIDQQQAKQQQAALPPTVKQLHRRQSRHAGVSPMFVQLLQYCDVCARSESMVDWIKGAYGIQQLVRHVSSPLQAQQAWQVAVTLQSHPLYKNYSRVLGGSVVALVEVTLTNHDHSVLQQLMAGRLLGFSFNSKHVDRLIRAANRADVGLEELQALLDMLPAKLLTNRAYYILINCFMTRGQYTEAAHCFHQMEAAGLRMTPSLQVLQEQLRTARPAKATAQ